jgi:hypothetical protein
METVVERPAALDVHKEQVTACVRVPGGGTREEHVAEFKTTVQGLLALRDWLQAHGVTQVAMEASGVCWKPRTAERTCEADQGTMTKRLRIPLSSILVPTAPEFNSGVSSLLCGETPCLFELAEPDAEVAGVAAVSARPAPRSAGGDAEEFEFPVGEELLRGEVAEWLPPTLCLLLAHRDSLDRVPGSRGETPASYVRKSQRLREGLARGWRCS